MQCQGVKGLVLARIPDLSRSDEADDPSAVSSGGRLLSQALSFRLLGIVVLLLMGSAVLKFAVGRSHSDGPVADGGSQTSVATTDAVPVWTGPAAKPPAPAPVVLTPAPAAEAAPCPVAAHESPTPVAKAAGPLMSSPWPNPAHAVSTGVEARDVSTKGDSPIFVDTRIGTVPDSPPAGANRAMAIRSSEYIGNNDDRTGSSIH